MLQLNVIGRAESVTACALRRPQMIGRTIAAGQPTVGVDVEPIADDVRDGQCGRDGAACMVIADEHITRV